MPKTFAQSLLSNPSLLIWTIYFILVTVWLGWVYIMSLALILISLHWKVPSMGHLFHSVLILLSEFQLVWVGTGYSFTYIRSHGTRNLHYDYINGSTLQSCPWIVSLIFLCQWISFNAVEHAAVFLRPGAHIQFRLYLSVPSSFALNFQMHILTGWVFSCSFTINFRNQL